MIMHLEEKESSGRVQYWGYSGRTTEEKNLSALIAGDCKMSKQCNQAAVKANKILGCNIREITSKKKGGHNPAA